mmetsp:Transcript_11022/g.9753  ORF Transcript_11022/g.9753 Transcript_11022/m.9753 type:complete len:192 (+) Transcript_11022:56-631(+)
MEGFPAQRRVNLGDLKGSLFKNRVQRPQLLDQFDKYFDPYNNNDISTTLSTSVNRDKRISRIFTNTVLKSASIEEPTCTNFLDKKKIKKIIQDVDLYSEIKDQLKRYQAPLHKMLDSKSKMNANNGSMYSGVATMSTKATRRSRPKTANYQSTKDRNKVNLNTFYKNLESSRKAKYKVASKSASKRNILVG